MRLNKFIAHSGLLSRRKAEQLIEKGEIFVNGVRVKEPFYDVQETDEVRYGQRILQLEQDFRYVLLNKPVGYTSTVEDPHAQKTVLDLVPYTGRLYPVGRLDRDSRGMLLLTNDGSFTYQLTHPKHDQIKTYLVKVKPKPDEIKLERLRAGVVLDGYQTKPCKIRYCSNDKQGHCYKVQIKEGRNRQIRRMFQLIGSQVVDLQRIGIGKLRLNGLREGSYRELTSKEVEILKQKE